MSFTVIDSANVSDPPLFVAVTVNVAVGETCVGVPVRLPVPESSTRPCGSGGDIVKRVASPPFWFNKGRFADIPTPTLYVAGALENESNCGAASFTVTSSLYALLPPPELDAVIVTNVVATTFPGVPEILPLVVSNKRPWGTAGSTEKLVGTPPDTVGVFTAIPTPLT